MPNRCQVRASAATRFGNPAFPVLVNAGISNPNQDQRPERAGLPNLLAKIQNDLIDPTPCNRFPRKHDHKGSCQRLTGHSTIRLLRSINGIGSSKHYLILYARTRSAPQFPTQSSGNLIDTNFAVGLWHVMPMIGAVSLS